MNTKSNKMLTINQVARILGISRPSVYGFIKDEENPLPVIYLSERTPRIKDGDLDVWIDKQNQLNEQWVEKQNRKPGNLKFGII